MPNTHENPLQHPAEQPTLLERMLDAIPAAAFAKDADFRWIYVNQALERGMGRPRGEILGRTDHELFPADQAALFRSRDQEVLGDGRTRTNEARTIWNGREASILSSKSLFLDPGTGRRYILGVVQDVSELRQAHEALRESELLHRAVATLTPVALVVHREGLALWANPAAAAFYGLDDAAALAGMDLWAGMTPEGREILRERIRQAREGGQALPPREYEIRRLDGTLRTVEARLTVIPHKGSQALLTVFQDVTELRRATQALERSESTLRAVFNSVHSAVFLHAPDGRILDVNDRMLELFGVTREQALTLSVERELSGPGAELERLPDIWRQVLAGQALTFDWRSRRPGDGSLFDVEVHLRRVDLPAGPRILATVTDITDRTQALAALAESETRYRTLARNFPNGMVLLFDPQMRFLLAEGLALESLGLAPEDLVGKTPSQFFPPELSGRLEEIFRQALAGDTTLMETPLADRVHEVRALPVTDASGRVVAGMAVSQDISGRKRLEEQLRHQALHDPLTGLANRTLCLDRIRQAIERVRRRPGYNYAVVFVDLDRFKLVNDSMGHKFGDALLVEAASRLLDCVRDLDTVARLGGDEFVLILEELESPRRAIQVVRRVREALGQRFSLGQRGIELTASMGVVVATRHYRTAEDVLQNANLAMHRAKEMGRDRYKLFTNRMLDAAVHRLNLESGLQQALTDNQLFLVYQPIVRLGRDYSLYGFEALVRWRHPERGVIGPSEFIPVAEESGLIVELGLWVLRAACRTFAAWRASLPLAEHLTLSVNISGRQFAQADLLGSVRRALQDSGMAADRLKLEITETALMENASRAVERLLSLRDLGIRLSVDDFGTGYSNMIYLQQLPLDHLKIDLSFVQNMDVNRENVAIVKAIISLAHTLGMEVVAEGVERPRHHEILSLLDCEYGQGYLYSPPLPEDEVPAFIHDFGARPLPA